jgi:hypothetical protein
VPVLEYLFFDQRPWQDFVDYVRRLGVPVETAQDDEEWLVYLPEELDDETDEKIEAHYEILLEMSELLTAEQQGEARLDTAGIKVNLMDGRAIEVEVDRQLVSRLLLVVTSEELRELVRTIAQAVEKGG